MVRLRREIEGLKRDHGKQEPIYLKHPICREILDELLMAAVRSLEWDKGGRVLLVSPPVSLARELLSLASHVTVVESSSERASQLREGLKDVADVRTLTIHEKEYAEISFERSAFDLIVSFDDLNGYFSPGNAVRKYGRELKVSGVFAGRACFAEKSEPNNSPGRWTISQDEFERESEGGFQLEGIERIAVSGMLVGKLSGRLPQVPPWLVKRAFAASLQLDKRLSRQALEQVPAVAHIFGAKSLGFGSVFSVD